MAKNVYLLVICLLFSSCGSVRVFQEKVPEPIKKKDIHKDTEKQGAYYLAVNTDNENKDVANALSRSLGIPKKIEEKPNNITEKLFAYTSEYQDGLSKLNTKLDTLQGKEIDGTGLNIMPFTSILGIVLIGLLFILFPSAITILFFILKRTRKAFSNVVTGVEEFTKSHPVQAKDLQDVLDKKMDKVEKVLKEKYTNG
jgi:hypothetical protein